MERKEAMKILKDFHDKSALFSVRTALDTILPELRESEDEKIRKDIVAYLKSVIDNKGYRDKFIESWIAWLENTQYAIDHAKREGFQLGYKAGIEKQGEITEPIEDFDTEFERQVSHLIASAINREHEYNKGYVKWAAQSLIEYAKREIEWQCEQKSIKEHDVCDSCEDRYGCASPCPTKLIEEQKPADEVKPKFHDGEWIIHHGTENIYQVVSIIDNQYQLKYGDNYTIQNCADVDRCARLWDITKDAKDGDVLVTKNKNIFIFKSISDCTIYDYCGLYFGKFIDFSATVNGSAAVKLPIDYVPATKEQRDLLFAKMKEAGYEWDAEKKELKKIVVPIFKIGDTIIKKHNSDILYFGSFTITDITGGKYWYNDRIICDITEQDEWELYEPVSQKSAEWSEEDENIRLRLIDYLYGKSRLAKDREDGISWLKSLKNRYTWKPSDEQMDMLAKVCSTLHLTSGENEIMESIYDALKKLMEK